MNTGNMKRTIRIIFGTVTAEAVLGDTPTADAVWGMLPYSTEVQTWGDEIYFTIPVTVPLAGDAAETVQAGDIAYWPEGPAFCLFFGPTPISTPGEIRPASAVNVFGRLCGDPSVFRNVRAGDRITIARADA